MSAMLDLLAVSVAGSGDSEKVSMLTRPLTIVAIDGMAGVGKSALAIQAGHLLTDADLYPDGQLYVNLQGSAAGLSPVEPLDALGRMLRSLGVDPVAIPARLEEAAGRFRTLTANRRLLLLLDNARSAEQVRPLLPGGATCGVIVTSREVLATLEGCWTVRLDVLPEEQALQLLGRIVGAERTAVEMASASELVRLCGRLPLAIRIVGARLAARPALPMRELVEQLADVARRLEQLVTGELALRATFEVSLSALRESPNLFDGAAAEAFGLLGLPDGPDIGTPAAARLLDQPEPAAKVLLERLVDANLLDSPRSSRYRFHDLVRLYARECAGSRYTDPERLAAVGRIIGFYAATVWQALAVLRPGDQRLTTADRRWTDGGLRFESASDALNWLEAERANLLASIAQSAAADDSSELVELPGQLAQALFAFFYIRGYWRDWMWANELALEIARRREDRAGEARAIRDLGIVYEVAGDDGMSTALKQDALRCFRELGDRRGEAGSLNNLGLAFGRSGLHTEAIDCLQQSLAIYREMGDRRGLSASLTNLGVVYGRLGRHLESVASLEEGLSINQELEDQHAQVESLHELSVVYTELGRYDEAIALDQRSLAIAREFNITHAAAGSLGSLGVVYSRLGQHETAIECLRQALVIYRDLAARRGQVQVLRALGDVERARGRDQDARAAWLDGLAVGEELQISEVEEIRSRLSKLPPTAT
jgi:tetratricopeptide (TPR) repeat protein